MSNQTSDVVIIGAGIVGCSIAWQLARSGRTVVVVDQNRGPGNGSTGSSSANVRFHYSAKDAVAMSWESKHAWERWAEHLGVVDPLGMARFVKTGMLILDPPTGGVDRTLELLSHVGVPHERLSPAEVQDRYPFLDSGRYCPPKRIEDPQWDDPANGYLSAIYTPDAGFVDDPALAAHNVFHAASTEGARGIFGRQVVRVMQKAGRTQGVELENGDQITASCVVNAAGPQSEVINRLADVLGDFRVSTRPLRVEVHVVPSVDGFTVGSGPIVSDQDLGTYFRPGLDGQILIGGTHPQCDTKEWVEDSGDFDPRVSLAAYETQTLRFARRVPTAKIPFRPMGIAGIYDVSDDWMPIYDRTALQGFYVAVGTSGNQFKNGPVVGSLMRQIIESCESGSDHDSRPEQWALPYTRNSVSLGHYSRLRGRDDARVAHSVIG